MSGRCFRGSGLVGLLAVFLPVLAVFPFGAQALAQEMILSSPIDCSVGEQCFIQNYVDRDPGPGFADYRCGALGYDGHKGTDFRVRDLDAMRAGVDVLAAADGIVRGVRDGMPDVSIAAETAPNIEGRECGNGVRIEHDGFATLYCHLKRDSLVVSEGERVSAGTVLGEVGLSGMTEFPHVHFEVLRGVGDDRTPVDPFDSGEMGDACGLGGEGVWRSDLTDSFAYRDRIVLNAGFADGPVRSEAIEDGAYAGLALTRRSPALVFYARVIGLRAGDDVRIRFVAPDGSELASNATDPLPRPSAQQMLFSGKRPPDGGWPAGVYRGEVRVLDQSGVVAAQRDFSLRLD